LYRGPQGSVHESETMSILQGWLRDLICHSDMLEEIYWKCWWQEHEMDLLRFKLSKSRQMWRHSINQTDNM